MRLTSKFFVGTLIRRVQGAGGFAHVARMGNEQAGAVHIAVYDADRRLYTRYGPGPPAFDADVADDQRRFVLVDAELDEQALRLFGEREAEFDPDFWLVEVEDWSGPVDTLIDLDAS